MPRASPFLSFLLFAPCAVACDLTSFPEPTHRAAASGGHGGAVADDGSRGTGCDGSKPFPSTQVLDDFERPNGAVGPNWIGSAANFALENGAVSGDSEGGDAMFFHEQFGGDQEVFATLVAFDPELYDMSLVFKAQSAGGDCASLRVRYANGYTLAHSVLVTQCESSTYSILRDHEVPQYHPGARIGARVFADGCVEVFAHDGEPDGGEAPRFDFLYSVNAQSFSSIGYPGYVGLYSQPLKSGGPGAPSVWDDFGGGSVR